MAAVPTFYHFLLLQVLHLQGVGATGEIQYVLVETGFHNQRTTITSAINALAKNTAMFGCYLSTRCVLHLEKETLLSRLERVCTRAQMRDWERS